MQKYAAILTPLQTHQKAALRRALQNNLILAHSTGSGKTLTSIAIADALGKPTTVLTPASLVTNFQKELQKHKQGGPPVNVVSLPTAVLHDYKIPKGNTVIIDEAHSLRNSGTARQEYIKRQLENAGRVIALTGTPAYNNIEDWAPLVNIVSRQNIVPEDTKAFREKFIQEKQIRPSWLDRLIYGAKPGVVTTLKNADKLRKLLRPYVDVFDTDVEKPERIDEDYYAEMPPEQEQIYRYADKSLPMALRWKVRHNIPPSKSEAKMMNAFLQDVRQISNTPEGFQLGANPGAKLIMAARFLKEMREKDPHFRALVYSNYLGSGIDSYGRILDSYGIPYNKFTGSMSSKQKKEVVDAYNSGEVPIILGSGSASEGLDLQGTKLIQLLEPHFNNSKLNQVIGRGIRYKSHEMLPPEERKVRVQRFFSTLPETRGFLGLSKHKDTSVDEYMKSRAAEKDELIRQVKEVLT